MADLNENILIIHQNRVIVHKQLIYYKTYCEKMITEKQSFRRINSYLTFQH